MNIVREHKKCGFWDDFVASYGFEGMFFGRCQVFRLGPF